MDYAKAIADELTVWAAMDDKALLERHTHDTAIWIDLVGCPRCRAEHTLITVAQTRLRETA